MVIGHNNHNNKTLSIVEIINVEAEQSCTNETLLVKREYLLDKAIYESIKTETKKHSIQSIFSLLYIQVQIYRLFHSLKAAIIHFNLPVIYVA